ncbi:hypothetical protein A3K81_04720 [Candidatus Bathyarchaeota archaeon RBG_13_60_20]|nr:MAG: hypothetical protein A3K81_04720 [Candidatus Bathyarchaeota archaeon RBG_13_60_20]
MVQVSIVKNPRKPTDKDVHNMVKKAMDLVGGIKSIVKPGQTVALKPNVVTGRVTGPGVVTDKRIVEVMIRLCKEAEAGKVLVVEGAGYFTETGKALELSGVKAMAEEAGAEVVDVDMDRLVELKVPNPLIVDKIKVSKSFMDADVRINLPVMKTHDQLLVTLGVKNLKGVVQKPMKREFHRVGVVKGIIDLSKVVPLNLTVLDAIVAMEGLGPSFGSKVHLDTVMASKDVWALDRVASRMMGFTMVELDYLVQAAEHGLFDPAVEPKTVGEPLYSYTHRFERPPTDTNFAEGVTVISEGACSACRGTIHSVVYDLEQMKMMGEIRDLFIVVGSNAEVPRGLPNTPIIMGTCLKRHEAEGCYVEGCPPNNDKMLAAIRQVCRLA